jgi:hypothetical protein
MFTQMDHMVRPGQTIGNAAYGQFCGGKGLTQSITLATDGISFDAGSAYPWNGNPGLMI